MSNTALLDPDAIGPNLKALFGGERQESVISAVATDDCSAVAINGTLLVLSSDFVNAAPIGLELGLSSHEDLGYYLVGSNVSDLLGSGARPFGLLVNVMWNRDSSSDEFWSLMQGVREAAAASGAIVLGGDTKLTSGRTVLNATAIGTVNNRAQLFLHGNARVGDGIWLSGGIGACGAAVIGLDAGFGEQSWLTWATLAISRPTLPLRQSSSVSLLELSAGGIDISDGLGADLTTVCNESGVGASVDLDKIPTTAEICAVADRVGVHPGSFGLAIGGDLQFAITAPGHELELEDCGMTRIGEVVAHHDSHLIVGGRTYPMPTSGHRDARGQSFTEEIEHLIRGFEFND